MEGYIFFLFVLVGANCHQWAKIEIIMKEIEGYNNASEQIKKQGNEQLERISEAADKFISDLGKHSMVEAVNKLPDNDLCKRNLTSLTDLKVSFKIQLSNNQRDLMTWVSDIETKLSQAISEASSYKNIIDSKSLACSFVNESSICLEKIAFWLEEKLNTLKCRLITKCTEHALSKRSFHTLCFPSSFECLSSGQCIPLNSFCDGNCDCEPCDDEIGCSRRLCSGRFLCENLQCVEKAQLCNGVDDCRDGSDEKACQTKKCSLETGYFHCIDGACIGLGEVCDGKNDCADGSDEGGLCGLTSCEDSCSTADGVCLGTPRGSQCLSHCPPGTGETSAGCLPGPKPSATISEMLEDFPRLMTRYQSLYKWLRRKTLYELVNSVLQVSKCKGGVYDSLDDLILLSSLNNRTTTHRPHTTTQRPHITTDHTHPTTYRP